ncbi:MAG TPA: ribonuclease III [Candidatus Absconditabacterales bacterium]|nr:ribonuclease III [Candidatus Absconditabacterales bacterium]
MFDQVLKKKKDLISYLTSLGIPTADIHNESLLLLAFVHKSYAADYKDVFTHNERLEFVGDGVLGAVINKLLFVHHQDMAESDLTLYKIALVREEILAEIAKDIKLNEMVFISKGEEKMQGRQKDSILSDTLEALIGYLYIDLGIDVTEQFIKTYVYSKLENIEKHPVKSYKTMIQEIVQKEHKVVPEYKDSEHIVDEKGNVTEYKSEIYIVGKKTSEGFGSNKKKAQEEAAKKCYEIIKIEN